MTHAVQRALVTTACILAVAVPAGAHAQAFRRDAGAAGFATNSLAANDDGSTGLVSTGFGLNFFGGTFTQLYVNNNGNVTFNGPLSQFTPSALTGPTSNPIIAAFFADVDTRGAGSALTRYGTGTVDGRAAFGVNWDGVGYYAGRTDKLNIFQLILIDRTDTGAGNFDIEFNYDQMQWETGEASGGVDGLGGTSAAVGYSSGSGTVGTFAQLNGSFINGALINGGANALVSNSINSAVNGRYLFNVRNGVVVNPPTTVPEPSTYVLVGVGLAGVVAAARRRAVS